MNTRGSRRWYLALLLPLLGLGCSDASEPAPFPESTDLEQRLAADLESPVFLELDGERAFLLSLQANHWTHRWCMLADRQGKAVLDRRGQPQIDPTKVSSKSERDRCFYEASSIVGHAFYLMTFGGQNATSRLVVRNPIGWETAQPLWLAMLVRAPLAGELRALMPPTMLDLADRQLAMARAVSPDTANAVGCAWEAVGVLRSGTTQRFTGQACTLAAPISCAGRRDGVYCDELSPYAAVRCKGGAIAGAPPPCPTGKTCRPQGGFIGNPAIMTSDKALTCFSPAE